MIFNMKRFSSYVGVFIFSTREKLVETVSLFRGIKTNKQKTCSEKKLENSVVTFGRAYTHVFRTVRKRTKKKKKTPPARWNYLISSTAFAYENRDEARVLRISSTPFSITENDTFVFRAATRLKNAVHVFCFPPDDDDDDDECQMSRPAGLRNNGLPP